MHPSRVLRVVAALRGQNEGVAEAAVEDAGYYSELISSWTANFKRRLQRYRFSKKPVSVWGRKGGLRVCGYGMVLWAPPLQISPSLSNPRFFLF